MGKHTTQEQFGLLVAFMEKHPDLGRGWVKTDNRPEHVDKLWEEISTDLNALGLPKKDVTGWKKVWSDYKAFIKKKLIQNKKEITATGGGEYQLYLSPLEETVVRLTSMEKAVSGIEKSRRFGVSEKKRSSVPLATSLNVNQRTENLPKNSEQISYLFDLNSENQETEIAECQDSQTTRSSTKRTFIDDIEIDFSSITNYEQISPKRSRHTINIDSTKSSTPNTAIDQSSPVVQHIDPPQKSASSKTHILLEKQIEMNQRFQNEKMKKFDEMIASNKELASCLKRNYRATEKLCDIQKTKTDLLNKHFKNEATHRLRTEQDYNKKWNKKQLIEKSSRSLNCRKLN